MDKGCNTCKHDRVGFILTCADCTASGTFKRWVPKPDPVNHPAHYTTGCGFECIEVMEMVFGKEAVHDFCTLNAFKYLWRYRQKGGADDIGKAKWYLEYTKGLNVFKNRQAIDKMREHIEREEAHE